jgi:adenylosuccinate lyase
VYGVFAATERLMMEAVRQGGNRQELHEVIRQHSLTAWEAVRKGDANPLRDLLAGDAVILGLMDRETALGLLEAGDYVGDAGERARNLAGMVEDVVG